MQFTSKSLAISSALVLVVAASFALAAPLGCDDNGCETDADCDGLRCGGDGSCVACTTNGDCNDSQFCCSGACLNDSDLDDHCGCLAKAGSGAGDACHAPANVCLAGDHRADRDDVSSGQCGCTCEASEGGSICTLDDSTEGFSCSCDRTDPDGTCGKPALDDNHLPHVVADTCTPSNECVCFSALAPCDPNSGTPDCSAGGCVNVFGDVGNCGVKERVCSLAASGKDDLSGTCVNGGCECDQATDCQDADLNVDTCVILTAGGQCVCGDYEANGDQAPCPLGLACVAGGCSYSGAAYATDVELFDALGI